MSAAALVRSLKKSAKRKPRQLLMKSKRSGKIIMARETTTVSPVAEVTSVMIGREDLDMELMRSNSSSSNSRAKERIKLMGGSNISG